jgi:hypothetical protein
MPTAIILVHKIPTRNPTRPVKRGKQTLESAARPLPLLPDKPHRTELETRKFSLTRNQKVRPARVHRLLPDDPQFSRVTKTALQSGCSTGTVITRPLSSTSSGLIFFGSGGCTVHPNQITSWKAQLEEGSGPAMPALRYAAILDQAHSLKLELSRKLLSLHDPPPAPSKHLSSEPGAGQRDDCKLQPSSFWMPP